MQEISRLTAIDWDRVRPVLDEVMQQLGGADREAVLLRFFEQRSYAEIGAALQATEDAARMRVERALEKLRTRLAARGVSSTAAALATALGQQLTAAPAGLAASVAGNAVAAASVAVGTGLSVATLSTVGALGLAGLGAVVVWSTRQPPTAPAPVSVSVVESRAIATLPAPATALGKHIVIDAKDRAAGRLVPPADAPPVKKKVPPTRQSTIEQAVSAYTPLIEQLGLNAAEAGKFRTFLAARAAQRYDVNAVAQQQRLASEDVVIRDLLSEADEELATALRQEFGAPFLAAYQRYFRGLAYAKTVNSLAHQLADTPVPVDSAQVMRLRELLADRGGLRAEDSVEPFEWARPVLSPAQLAALRARAAGAGGR